MRPEPGRNAPPDSRAPGQPLRVIVADGADTTRAELARRLAAAGHVVAGAVGTAAEAVALAATLAPDVVLLGVRLPDAPGSAAAARIAAAAADRTPAVVLCAADADGGLGADVEQCGAAAVVATAAPGTLLDAAVRLAAARARELDALRAECAAALRRLEERKLIERAKGVLMRRTGTSEQEAYRILQRSSQDRATPMATLARAVLDSEAKAASA